MTPGAVTVKPEHEIACTVQTIFDRLDNIPVKRCEPEPAHMTLEMIYPLDQERMTAGEWERLVGYWARLKGTTVAAESEHLECYGAWLAAEAVMKVEPLTHAGH